MSNGFVLTKPSEIEFASMCALKGAVGLECKGLKMSRGRSAVAIAKQRYNLRGKPEKIFAQLQQMVEDAVRDAAAISQLVNQ
jgi:hypothetical protein